MMGEMEAHWVLPSTVGNQEVAMLATELTIGNPVSSPKLQEWHLALCGLDALVPSTNEPKPPMQHSALEGGGG